MAEWLRHDPHRIPRCRSICLDFLNFLHFLNFLEFLDLSSQVKKCKALSLSLFFFHFLFFNLHRCISPLAPSLPALLCPSPLQPCLWGHKGSHWQHLGEAPEVLRGALPHGQNHLAERLRHRPAKPMGSPRVGSNAAGVASLSLSLFPFLSILSLLSPLALEPLRSLLSFLSISLSSFSLSRSLSFALSLSLSFSRSPSLSPPPPLLLAREAQGHIPMGRLP